MLFALIVLLLALFVGFTLLPAPPTPLNGTTLRGTPLQVPGPVISGAISGGGGGVVLDGLTIIPLVSLPPIKFTLSIPFTSRRLHVIISSTASETIFPLLRLGRAEFRAVDAGRSPMSVKVDKVDTDFKGSFSVKVNARLLAAGECASSGTSQGKVWKWSGAGRVAAKINGAGMDIGLQLVKRAKDGETRVEVLSSSVDEGIIESATVEGFGRGGGIATALIPYIKGTVFVKWPTKVIVDFLSRDIVEGGVLDEMLRAFWATGEMHTDYSTWGAMIDAEREKEVATPLDMASLAPPSSPSSSSRPSTPVPVRSASPTPSSSKLRMHCHLIGPTLLRNFPLPDFSPSLYRPGGARAALQQFNLLTSEVQLNLTNISLSRITFDRASLAFDPPKSSSRPKDNSPPDESEGLGGGDLVVTVQDFVVVLESRFSIGADTSSVVSWTTGVKRLGEKGTSTTTVTARSLQLRFALRPASKGRVGAPYELAATSMSPFTAIEPRFELDKDSKLRLGAELVNVVTSGLKTQIASTASLVIKLFVQDAVRGYLQTGMDGIEEKLRDAGVELPHGLRAAGGV